MGTRYCGGIGFLLDFTGKFPCQSFFFSKLAGLRPGTLFYFKKIGNSSEFCEISKNTSGGCFCHLSRYFDKLYDNIVHKMQSQMSNFIQVTASIVFAAISEFWFSGFSRHTIFKLITGVTAFLIKIDNKKLDQKISKLLTLSKYFTCSLILFYTCGILLNIPRGYLH